MVTAPGFARAHLLLLSLPWILCIVTPPPSSAAPSAAHDGHTHPALQPGDFASIPHPRGEEAPEALPSTESPVASAAPGEEIPFDPHPVVTGRDPRPSRRVRDEFYRPKRTVVVGDIVTPSPADLEDLVSNLKTQLKESQAAQVHTRSIINVLQEKVEAQENDLSIMKNEISQMRREQAAQRELIASIKSSSSDTSWAIASVKHSQDQTAADLMSLKHLQDHQNETLLVMEEVIMSNALELQNHHKHVGAIRQDLFQLRTQITEDRDKMNKIQRTVVQLQTGQKVQSGAAITDENNIEEEEIEMTNHLSPYAAEGSSSRGTAAAQGQKSTGLVKEGEGTVTSPPGYPLQSKLSEHDLALEMTKGLLGNLSEHVTSVENRVMLLSQKQLLDSQLLQLQQSFMNFTSQVYQLQHWRVTNAARDKEWEDEEYKTQHENDMASVIFHLENHSERIRALESLTTAQHTDNQLAQQRLNASLDQLNTTFEVVLKEVIEQTMSPRFDDGKQLVIEGRVKVVEEELKQTFDKVKDLDLALMNASLTQCKAVNDQLTEEVRSGGYVKQIADVQMKISEQTTSIARLDRGLAGIFQELDKNAGTSSSLAEQVTELKKLSPEVVTMQRELLNFVLQLPIDCYDVPAATGNSIHDGVYLIRPEVSRQSARTFCLVEDDVVWTVIQRRRDGRESFARSWDDYRQGFGDAGGEFWLGNENIHKLTDGARIYRLRIDMWDVLGRYWLADYASFRVHAEDALYRLELGDFGGNATDALRYSNLMPFSALDRDNDVSTTHCAQFYQSGWWYKHCHYSNLNGRYTAGMVWFHQDLDEWIQMKQTTMRIAMVMGDAAEPRGSG